MRKIIIFSLCSVALVGCGSQDKPNAEMLGKQLASKNESIYKKAIKKSLKYCQWGGYGYMGDVEITHDSVGNYKTKKNVSPLVKGTDRELLSYYTDITPKGWGSSSYCQKVYTSYINNVETNYGKFAVKNFSDTIDIFTHGEVVLKQKNIIRFDYDSNVQVGDAINE